MFLDQGAECCDSNRTADKKKGIARHLDSSGLQNRLYLIGFFKGDAEAMKRQVEWFAGRPEEYQIRELQARSLAFAGRRREASETLAQAAQLAGGRGLVAEKARILANEANMNAIFGFTQPARNQALRVLTLIEKEHIAPEELLPSLIGQLDSQPLVCTLALCGEARRAQSLADELGRRFSEDTMHNSVWLPMYEDFFLLWKQADVELPVLIEARKEYEATANLSSQKWQNDRMAFPSTFRNLVN